MRKLLSTIAILISLCASAQGEMQQFFALSHNDTVVVIPCTLDADACTAINAIQATGVTLTTTQKNAIDTLVRDFKGQTNPGYTTGVDFWTNAKAYWPTVGGTANSHAINLRSPGTFNLVYSGTWVHDSSGADPNGVNAYANTAVIPSTQLSTSSAHFSYYSVENAGTIGTSAFVAMGTFTSSIVQLNITGANVIIGNSAAASYTPTTTVGFWLANRVSTSDLKAYKNGVQVGTSSTSVSSLPATAIYLGARNDNGVASLFAPQKYVFASIGPSLGANAAIFSTIVNAFETRLGRNVY